MADDAKQPDVPQEPTPGLVLPHRPPTIEPLHSERFSPCHQPGCSKRARWQCTPAYQLDPANPPTVPPVPYCTTHAAAWIDRHPNAVLQIQADSQPSANAAP